MTNEELYKQAFINSFGVDGDKAEAIKYQSIEEWDSVGHLSLIIELEAAFAISMDMDDITELSSYAKGKEILSKYHVEF